MAKKFNPKYFLNAELQFSKKSIGIWVIKDKLDYIPASTFVFSQPHLPTLKKTKEFTRLILLKKITNRTQETLCLTSAMRQAVPTGGRDSIDKLRIREMSVFKRTILDKSPALKNA